MGRMLEVMQRGDRPEEPEKSPTSEPSVQMLPLSEEAPSSEEAEEIPYIEVGGRGKAVDASPSVLQGPAARSRPEMAIGDQKVRFDAPAPRSATLTSATHRGFTFQPGDAQAPKSGRIAAEIIAFHEDAHPVSQQYRMLFSKIQDALPHGEPAVLLFTSITPGAGTTTTLLNLAVTCSRHGKQRVVVVDANLARPAAARRLGVIPRIGLAEVLSGSAALEQALAASPQPDLQVLATVMPAVGSHLLCEENLRWLAARLRERFDLVLVDGPAWAASQDEPTLAAVADATYLVVDAADAESPPVRKVTRMLAQRGWRLGGIIVGQS